MCNLTFICKYFGILHRIIGNQLIKDLHSKLVCHSRYKINDRLNVFFFCVHAAIYFSILTLIGNFPEITQWYDFRVTVGCQPFFKGSHQFRIVSFLCLNGCPKIIFFICGTKHSKYLTDYQLGILHKWNKPFIVVNMLIIKFFYFI